MPSERTLSIMLTISCTACLLLPAASWAVVSFGAPVQVSSQVRDQNYAVSLATDRAGTWIGVWRSQGLGDTRIVSSRTSDGGKTWSAAVRVSAAGESDPTSPDVTTDAAGTWIALWRTNAVGGNTIEISRSIDNGSTWSAPAVMEQSLQSFGATEVAVTSSGTWCAMWTQFGGPQTSTIFVARSLDGGFTWAAPQPIAGPISTVSHAEVDLAASPSGELLATWSERVIGVNSEFDIWTTVSSDGGATWSVPQQLNTDVLSATGDNFRPRAATNGTGHWIVVWSSSGDLATATDYDIAVTRSSDHGATWSLPVRLNTNAATDFGFDEAPDIASDGTGTWIATWASDTKLGPGFSGDYNILMAQSSDNGATWTAPEALNTTATTEVLYDNNPRLAADGAGHWIAVWEFVNPFGGYGPDIAAAVGGVGRGPSGGGGGGGCFIATAAYGTPMAGELDRMRAFRDERLAHSASGAAFVDAYYRLSPAAAGWIAAHPDLRPAVRLALAPFTRDPAAASLTLLLGPVVLVALRGWFRRTRKSAGR